MTRTLVGLITAVSFAATPGRLAQAPPRDPNVKRELRRLQGAWHFEQLVEDGKEATPAALIERGIFFGGDAYIIKQGDQFLEVGTHKLDPSRNPKTINAMITQGPRKGDVLLGIYELEDDTFKVCFDTAGQSRPTEFNSEAGSGIVLAVYKRVRSAQVELPDITGDYVAESSGNGISQTADVSIERLGDAYRLTYMRNGAVVSVGIAIRKGDTLSMCFALQGQAGIAVYEIQKGPKLVGEYTSLGGIGLMSPETLTRKPRSPRID